jgi:hypothetical protein
VTAGSAPFLLSIEPVVGESLPGYVARLAQRMMLPTTDVVAAKAGLRQPGMAFAYASLSGLSSMAGIAVERLNAIAYQQTQRPGHYGFLDGVLQREFIDLKTRRACPDCLQVSGIVPPGISRWRHVAPGMTPDLSPNAQPASDRLDGTMRNSLDADAGCI